MTSLIFWSAIRETRRCCLDHLALHRFEYEGELINGTVVIAPGNIEPIAGTHVLQDFRLVLDLVHHMVKRGRAMKAK
jgi:hypothetical protein